MSFLEELKLTILSASDLKLQHLFICTDILYNLATASLKTNADFSFMGLIYLRINKNIL